MQSLSGLFCASLGQSLTNTFTTRPYVPHLTSPSSLCPSLQLPFLHVALNLTSSLEEPAPFHTTSPPSGLCTENLTPFLKLLPSKGKSGLSGLLKSHRVLAGHWHSMDVKAEREKAIGTEEEAFRVEMSIEVVWDLVGRQQRGGLRGWYQSRSWTMASLMASSIIYCQTCGRRTYSRQRSRHLFLLRRRRASHFSCQVMPLRRARFGPSETTRIPLRVPSRGPLPESRPGTFSRARFSLFHVSLFGS